MIRLNKLEDLKKKLTLSICYFDIFWIVKKWGSIYSYLHQFISHSWSQNIGICFASQQSIFLLSNIDWWEDDKFILRKKLRLGLIRVYFSIKVCLPKILLFDHNSTKSEKCSICSCGHGAHISHLNFIFFEDRD